jgi:hypothetical protein
MVLEINTDLSERCIKNVELDVTRFTANAERHKLFTLNQSTDAIYNWPLAYMCIYIYIYTYIYIYITLKSVVRFSSFRKYIIQTVLTFIVMLRNAFLLVVVGV